MTTIAIIILSMVVVLQFRSNYRARKERRRLNYLLNREQNKNDFLEKEVVRLNNYTTQLRKENEKLKANNQ